MLVACARQPALKIGGGLQVLSVTLSSGQVYINERIGGQVPIPPPIGVLDPRPRPASDRRSRVPERLPKDAQAASPNERILRPAAKAAARRLRLRGITLHRSAVPPRPPTGSSEVLPDDEVGRIAMVPAMRVREQRWPR